MRFVTLPAFAVLALLFNTAIAAETAPAAHDGKLYFITPQNGDQVSSTFTIRIGVKSNGAESSDSERSDIGHSHLLVDMESPEGIALDMDRHVRHFDNGQTESRITLGPGPHTPQLLLGNSSHVPHDPPVVSEKISITVVP